MAHWRESTWATCRFDARRNASGRLEAPERRMSSPVMTWMAEGVSNHFSGCLETLVTSRLINSSRLMRLISVGEAKALVSSARAAATARASPAAGRQKRQRGNLKVESQGGKEVRRP